MKDTDVPHLIELAWAGGGFLPANAAAEELSGQLVRGEIVSFKEVTHRDLAFHKCYMLLLSEIWGYMPVSFKKQVRKEKFYMWLKHLQGNYNVLFEFKDGTKLVEYVSLSFGRMSQQQFRAYVKEQLPWIYENVIGKYFQGEIYNTIIDNLETDFEKFMAKL